MKTDTSLWLHYITFLESFFKFERDLMSQTKMKKSFLLFISLNLFFKAWKRNGGFLWKKCLFIIFYLLENLNKSFIRLWLFRQLLIDKTTAPNKLHQYNKAKQSNRPCLDYDCPESWAITIVLIFNLKYKVQIFIKATPFLFRSVSWEYSNSVF